VWLVVGGDEFSLKQFDMYMSAPNLKYNNTPETNDKYPKTTSTPLKTLPMPYQMHSQRHIRVSQGAIKDREGGKHASQLLVQAKLT
jgi:hypothetical protein